jgi:hypothetical protein
LLALANDFGQLHEAVVIVKTMVTAYTVKGDEMVEPIAESSGVVLQLKLIE